MSEVNLTEVPYKKTLKESGVRNLLPEEQPREKLMKYGPDILTEAELLAILLRTGSKGMNVLETSRELIRQACGLSRLAKCNWDEIRNIKGVGSVKAVTLVAAFELYRRLSTKDDVEDLMLLDPEETYAHFGPMMRDLHKEVFLLLTMNSAKKLIRRHRVSIGGTNSTIVDIPEIIRLAVLDRARGIILLHNHPSGNTRPSGSDRILTNRIAETCKLMGIQLCDHIIIAGNSYTSFQEKGLLP